MRSDVPNIQAGQAITASYLNRLGVSAGARDVGGAYSGDRHGGSHRLVPADDPLWFLCQADEDVPAYGVGVLDGRVTSEDGTDPVFKKRTRQLHPI